MPAKANKREQTLIEWFVLGYENSTWAKSRIDRLDEKHDGAVEAVVTHPDGRTVAIEHTLIEPFVGERSDRARFKEDEFQMLESDDALKVPDAAITVYIPAGITHGFRRSQRQVIFRSIRDWIEKNRLQLRDGEHSYLCAIPDMPPAILRVRRLSIKQARTNPGILKIGRQQVVNDLNKVIERALLNKLPKLVKTNANRRVLLLERELFSFFPELIFAEIERQRPHFALLEKVDEIWHVETISYDTEGVVYFERRMGTKVAESFVIDNGALM